jgi:hypothetical protein
MGNRRSLVGSTINHMGSKRVSLIILSFVMLSFLSFSLEVRAQQCTASDHDCEAYLCMEEHWDCGKKGYLQKFGYKNCQKFLKNEPNVSENLKNWFPLVRVCLQEKIFDISENVEPKPKNCEMLKSQAFESHVDCYIETGFCELNFFDRLSLAQLVGKDLFLPESIASQQKILEHCEKNH